MQRYLKDLQDLEYIQQVGGNRYQGFKYKIAYWDDYKALRKQIQGQLDEQIKRLVTQGNPVKVG